MSATAAGGAARYAVYFTPPVGSALWQWGSAVIGYDSARGARPEPMPDPALAGLLTDAVQSEPRRYGFHATLRAPFELAPGAGVADLLAAAEAFAAARAAVVLPAVEPGLMGGFIALLCPSPPPRLAALAADVVRCFEPMRAPLSAADRQRRLKAPLSPRQLAHLDRWGYPYVLDDFIFHMTLTGRLPDGAQAESALALLRRQFAPLAAPVAVDAISVLEQPSRDAAFRLLRRFPFAAASPA